MGMTRIWNVTDDPSTDVVAQKLVVMGKEIMPGRFIQVDEALLERAHKLKNEIARKLVYVGKNPPGRYAAVKNPVKATLDASIARSHGGVEAEVAKTVVVVAAEEKTSESSSEVSTEGNQGSNKKKNRQWSSGQ